MSSGQPSTTISSPSPPPPPPVAWRATGSSGPVLAANSETAAVRSTSRWGPTIDSAAHPTRTSGCRMSSMAATASSRAPANGGVTKTRARSGRLAEPVEDLPGHLADGVGGDAGARSGRRRRASHPTLPSAPRSQRCTGHAFSPAIQTVATAELGPERDQIGPPPGGDRAPVVEPEQTGRSRAGGGHGVGQGDAGRRGRCWPRPGPSSAPTRRASRRPSAAARRRPASNRWRRRR